jgi:hypothetical protein
MSNDDTAEGWMQTTYRIIHPTTAATTTANNSTKDFQQQIKSQQITRALA